MKKVYFILFMLCALSVTLSVLLGQTQHQLHEHEQQILELTQSHARLNDLMVAVQREQVAANPAGQSAAAQNNAPSLPATAAPTAANLGLMSQQSVQSSKALLRSQLELVQFAITQQQYVYALEQLKKTNQLLQQQNLAAPIKSSLQQSLIADEKNILQQLSRYQQQQNLLRNALSKVDRQLQMLAPQAPSMATSAQPWWQRWLQIEPVSRPTPALMQRQHSYQMLQWRLQLAQQALLYGQPTLYTQQLTIAQELLQALPDAASQGIGKRIQQLQNQPQLSMPPLQTLALLR